MTVVFESDRIRMKPPNLSWSDFWEIPLYLASFVGMVGLFVLGASVVSMGHTVVGVVILVAALIVGVPVLFALLIEVLGMLLVPTMIVGAIVMVFFPAGRRRLKRWWRGGPVVDVEHEIRYDDVSTLSIEDSGSRTTVVIQGFEGPPYALVAEGAAGRRLRRALPDIPVPRTILRRDWRDDPRFHHLA